MDHSDPIVEYFCEALGFKYHLGYPWRIPRSPLPLTPLDPYKGGAMGGGAQGGMNEGVI